VDLQEQLLSDLTLLLIGAVWVGTTVYYLMGVA